MERSKHLFVFTARQIANAASARAVYHAARADEWRIEQGRAADAALAAASIKVKSFAVTGGERVELVVDYGDAASEARRMSEAFEKWQGHQHQADEYRSDAVVYGSQPNDREYELDPDDVYHYGLG